MKIRLLALFALPGSVFLLSVLLTNSEPAVAQGPQASNTPRPVSNQKATLTPNKPQPTNLRRSPFSANSIINGDFESLNTGFSSDYVYSQGSILNQGTYDIVSDPFNDHYAATSFKDHTYGDGSGLMLAANGSSTIGYPILWSETIAVTANTNYDFSAWVASWYPLSPAHLQFLFNSSSVGIFDAPPTSGLWTQFAVTWNSGSTTSATIQIVDLNNESSGNDFALDDLVLTQKLPTYSLSGRVTDDNGNPVSGASVFSSIGTSALTDASGNYTIYNLIMGTYSITPTLTGYRFAPVTRTNISLPPDATGKNFKARPAVPTAFLDLPFVYTPLNFASAALGNERISGLGRVNSWFDHQYPTYSDAPNSSSPGLLRYDGSFFPTDDIQGLSYYNGHNGIDFSKRNPSDPYDEVIYAAAPGTVIAAIYSNTGYGNQVWIDHHNGYATLYGHLKSISVTDQTIISVPGLTPLGIMGHTGNVKGGGDGTHLHFGVYYDNNGDGSWTDFSEAVDPYAFSGNDPWVASNGPKSFYLWKSSLQTNNPIGSSGATLTSPSGVKRASIPSGALNTTLTVLFGDASPVAAPTALLRSTGLSFLMQVQEWLTGSFRPTKLRPYARAAVGSFSLPVILTVTYGMTETRHLDASQLSIYRWDDAGSDWVTLPTTVDTNLMQASAPTSSPGNFDLQGPLLCPADNQEPDDVYYSSKQISINGAKVSRLFDTAQDEDWFNFLAVAGTKYLLQTSNLSSAVDTVIQVYDSDGISVLASDDNGGGGKASRLLWQAPSSGSYFIRVQQANGSAFGCNATYQISVIPPNPLYLPLILR